MNMQKCTPPSSRLVQKISFVSNPLSSLICHSSNGWKNLLFAFVLLFISSCKKDKKTDPVEKKVTSIAITSPSPSVPVGLGQPLTATIEPSDAAKKDLTWSSSDETKATVDATGKVTGKAEGTVVITATATDGSNIKGTITITITKTVVKATSITITPASSSVAVGFTQQLTATVAPADASKDLTWSSSNEKAATVDATGKVTGVAKGTTDITATAKDGSNVKATAVTVNVIVRATSIAITPLSPSVGIGGTLTLTAAALPAEAAQAVTWTSSAPTIATIDASTGIATGIALGSATITATAADGSGITTTTTLTVSNAVLGIITLGDEGFDVAVPAAGGSATVANAPDAVASDIRAVKVHIAAPANAVIKVGNRDFTQGQEVDFSSPVTFTVTADGTVKNYVITIPAYNATANPYGIYTVKHLSAVKDRLGNSYLLKNNIVLPSKDATDAATATGISDYASAGWKPIGYSYYPYSFTGTFDGGNFSINNFYINREGENVGLFGYVGRGGTVKNLGVNGIITGTAARGGEYAGILAARSEGTIDKCYATGSVSSSYSSYSSAGGLVGNGGTISNSYATGSVSSSSSSPSASAGGLVGSSGTISNSYATGSVSATTTSTTTTSSSSTSSSSAGGLVGSGGTISNSYATGSVSSSSSSSSASAGGLVGRNDYSSGNRISNSYATGSASATSSSSSASAGGLVGFNGNSISHSYATGNVSATSASAASAGGLTGHDDDATYTNCYRNNNAVIKKNNADATPNDASTAGITAKTKAYMQTEPFKGDLNGASGTAWGRNDGKNDKLPFIIGVGVGK